MNKQFPKSRTPRLGDVLNILLILSPVLKIFLFIKTNSSIKGKILDSIELKGNEPDLYIVYNDEVASEKLVYREYDPEILKTYGARIISYKYDEPIENEYK